MDSTLADFGEKIHLVFIFFVTGRAWRRTGAARTFVVFPTGQHWVSGRREVFEETAVLNPNHFRTELSTARCPSSQSTKHLASLEVSSSPSRWIFVPQKKERLPKVTCIYRWSTDCTVWDSAWASQVSLAGAIYVKTGFWSILSCLNLDHCTD